MARVKTSKEIEIMRQGGVILSRALQVAIDNVRPGITMNELDALSEKVLIENGAIPSFKGYKSADGIPFPSTLCISRNDEIVHGTGNRDIRLEDGDIVGLDIGCWFDGMCTDMAATVPVGKISKKQMQLISTTQYALEQAIEAVRGGGRLLDIARAVEGVVEGTGFGIVRALTGHGVGHAVHEPPMIPNYVSRHFDDILLEPGMCLAIEPMITEGSYDIMTDNDGWSIRTKDGKNASHFELTVAVTENGCEILTPRPIIKI